MAERPSPHSLVISTLIVLTSLPRESLESCTVDDSGSGELVYDYDNSNNNDKDEDRGRYPNLLSCVDPTAVAAADPSGGSHAGWDADVERDAEEIVMDDVREYILSSIQGSSSGGGGDGGGGYDPSPSSVLAALRSITTTEGVKTVSSPEKIFLSYLSHKVFRTVDTLHDYVYDVLAKCTKKGTAEPAAAGTGGRVTDPIVNPECFLGVYVRKHVLGFDMLSFESVARLWEECRHWVDDGWDWVLVEAQRQEQKEKVDDAARSSAAALAGPSTTSWPPTASQLSSHLHSLSVDDSAAVAAPPIFESTIEHLASISQHDPTLPKLHYAKFLACLRSGERMGAVESLHRYFDYAVIAGRKEAVGRLLDFGDAGGSGGLDVTGGTGANDRRGGANAQQQHQRQGGADDGGNGGGGDGDPLKPLSRYAPLLLAMLHHSHGQYDLARKSAEEAVRVGQQCSDGRAVTLALGWLALLDQDVGSGNSSGDRGGNGDGEELWSLARSRASRHGPSSLSARSSLALAQGRAQNVGHASSLPSSAASSGSAGVRPGAGAADGPVGGGGRSASASSSIAAGTTVAANLAAAWSDLASSTTSPSPFAAAAQSPTPHLAAISSAQPETTATGTTPLDRPTTMLPVNSRQALNDIDQIVRLQALVGSSLWDGVGRGDLSSIESKASVLPRGGDVNNLDASQLAVAVTKIAMEALEGSANGRGAAVDSASVLTAHQRCLEELETLRRSYPQMDADVWSDTVAFVLHDWSVRLGLDTSTSKMSLPCAIRLHLSSRIPGCTRNSDRKFSRDMVEPALLLMEAQTASLSSQKRYEQAMEITQQSIRLASQHSLHVHRARNLLRLANIRCDCIPSQPTLVLPPLLECLSVCEQHGIDPIHAAALGTLGKIHLLMGNCRMARSVINAAMPSMIQAAPSDVVAGALLTLVKCDLALAREGDSNSTGGEQRSKKLLHRSMSMLSEAERKARDMSNMLMLLEIHYLRAQICNQLGPNYVPERDFASKQFVRVSKWLRNGGEINSLAKAAPSNLSDPDSVSSITESLVSLSSKAMAISA